MAADVTRGQRIGNVLQWETDGNCVGFCRKELTVVVQSGMEVGSVLEETSVASKGTWVASGTEGNASCILIDEGVYDCSAGDNTLVVLYKGPSAVAQEALSYDGTVTNATAEAALEALNIKIVDSIA